MVMKNKASDRLTPKEAARRAQDFLLELLGPLENVLLEEVELSEDDNEWLITLSYMTRAAPPAGLTSKLSSFERCYKRFIVNARTGEVCAMHIRQV